MSDLSRRQFVTRSVLAAAAMQLPGQLMGQQTATPAGGAAAPALVGNLTSDVALHWLDGSVPALSNGATWGVPWPRGTFTKGQTFSLKDSKGSAIPVQTWPTAYWPDGSLKWTAHAIGSNAGLSEKLLLSPGTPATPEKPLTVTDTGGRIVVDTGVIITNVLKTGSTLIDSINRGGKTIASTGQLIAMRQDKPSDDEPGSVTREQFLGQIEKATVEQSGPLRAVIKLEGMHKGVSGSRTWLPFVVRLYFYAGAESVRIMHTFIFDGDDQKDFICGLGVRWNVAMAGDPSDRGIRFAGDGNGLWLEGVRNLTGLRSRSNLETVPSWGDYSLMQLSSDGFELRKRTKPGHGWIKVDGGKRASGLGYIGHVDGGVAFGMRDFWQKYPVQLDVRNAISDQAQVTVWLYSPEAPAMDLRFYHDGMGMDTYAKQTSGLDTTYEDYEPGFGTPIGIARTNEITLWALAGIPSREQLVAMTGAVKTPPILACDVNQYVGTHVFGGLFAPVDRSHPIKARIEDQNDFLIDFYKKQIDQRRWYGFWDYGDVMHSYDTQRHVWKYDVGGFAWDNSELSTDLWLWYSFLRSGRSDIYRLAEAMTRHTGEVDVYHLGRFKMLGTRHGVQHWGDSAKQLRISTAANRRFYYFLTADERVGDLMHELIEADQTFLALDPIRKVRRGAYEPKPEALGVGFGTDWGALVAAWLTEWERTGDTKWRDRIVAGMKTIGTMPKGYFSTGLFNLADGSFKQSGDPNAASASHLSSVFGLVEMNAEMILLVEVPEFEKAWLQYCELYNAGAAAQTAALGRSLGNLNLGEGHSRLTAYAAWKKKDPQLAQRAWNEFFGGAAGYGLRPNLQTTKLEGPVVLNPVDEAAWVSTNASAQWGLAAIQCLALVGDKIPNEVPVAARRGGGGAGAGRAGGANRGAARGTPAEPTAPAAD